MRPVPGLRRLEAARLLEQPLTAALDEAQTNALTLQEAFESWPEREKYTPDMDFGFLYSSAARGLSHRL